MNQESLELEEALNSTIDTEDTEEKKKYNLYLNIHDVNVLKSFYPRLGYSKAIRFILHAHCVKLEEKTRNLIQKKANDGARNRSGVNEG